MPKQKKIYILDKDENKIRTKKGYKSKTEKTTDWDEQSKNVEKESHRAYQ